MSYDTAKLVYGIPLSWDYYDLIDLDNLKKYIKISECFPYFTGLLRYTPTQSNSFSFAFGLEIATLSSYAHHSNITYQMLEVTNDMKEKFKVLIQPVPFEVKKIIESFGQPRLALIWSNNSS